MIRAAIAEQRAYHSWLDYQHALIAAVSPLTLAQLQHRVLPGRRTPGELAEHIVFGRALHLSRALPHTIAELAPYLEWNVTHDAPRSANDIVRGLETTWRVIERSIMHGNATDTRPTGERDISRAEPDAVCLEAVWGLLDHDLPHAGQLSLLLRAAGLPGVDI